MLIALQTSTGEHLGFILFASKDEAKDEGDCIFMILPKNPALFETKEYNHLRDIQDAGEFRFQFAENILHIKNADHSLSFERAAADERFVETKSGLSIFGLAINKKMDS